MYSSAKEKVISTCLFGGGNRISYHRYAVEAPKTPIYLKKHLPDWKFRMYHDDSAPKNILKILGDMENTQLIEMPHSYGREGCFWRFLAFDDCDVAVCRDLDFTFQENDLISMKEWLETEFKVHYIWVAHDRRDAWNRRNRRYHMAGCVSARNLPFKIKDLITAYEKKNKGHPTDDPSLFGADEYFLGEWLMPELDKHGEKSLLHIEPKCRKFNVEIFPEREEYRYLEKDWVGI